MYVRAIVLGAVLGLAYTWWSSNSPNSAVDNANEDENRRQRKREPFLSEDPSNLAKCMEDLIFSRGDIAFIQRCFLTAADVRIMIQDEVYEILGAWKRRNPCKGHFAAEREKLNKYQTLEDFVKYKAYSCIVHGL